MSDKMQARDLETMLAQFENGWQALKCLLHQIGAQVSQTYPDGPGLNPQENQEESGNLAGPSEADLKLRWQPEREKMQPRGIISPEESEEIIRRVETAHRDKEVLERLAKVEKQTRRLTILGAMFSTILILAMSVFAFLLAQAHLINKSHLFHTAQNITNANPPAPGAPEQKATAPNPVAPDQKASAPAPGATEQKASVQVPEADTPKYVGSITSNKYHFPDCKWAKTIAPEKLRTFKSVREAKEAGYRPCPVCKPPMED